MEDLAQSSGVVYWLGPLYNNLGLEQYEAGEFDAALSSFERALEAREGEPEKPAEIEIARYAIAKTLRALGRPDEAAALLEQCVENSEPDSFFHEELAENYALLRRNADAREHAQVALSLLGDGETERATRLDRLARS